MRYDMVGTQDVPRIPRGVHSQGGDRATREGALRPDAGARSKAAPSSWWPTAHCAVVYPKSAPVISVITDSRSMVASPAETSSLALAACVIVMTIGRQGADMCRSGGGGGGTSVGVGGAAGTGAARCGRSGGAVGGSGGGGVLCAGAYGGVVAVYMGLRSRG